MEDLKRKKRNLSCSVNFSLSFFSRFSVCFLASLSLPFLSSFLFFSARLSPTTPRLSTKRIFFFVHLILDKCWIGSCTLPLIQLSCWKVSGRLSLSCMWMDFRDTCHITKSSREKKAVKEKTGLLPLRCSLKWHLRHVFAKTLLWLSKKTAWSKIQINLAFLKISR